MKKFVILACLAALVAGVMFGLSSPNASVTKPETQKATKPVAVQVVEVELVPSEEGDTRTVQLSFSASFSSIQSPSSTACHVGGW